MSRLSIAVIAGGPSAEANVSRTSARAVCEALTQAGHRPELLELEPALGGVLYRGSFDVAFPTTHGPLGEDGCLQGLLEVMGLPYVGSGVLASALAADKPQAKRCFQQAGLPLAEGVTLGVDDDHAGRVRQIRNEIGPSLIVKPAAGGSAIATSRIAADEPDERVLSALAEVFAVDRVALLERLVPGKEVTCGVLENEAGIARALPPTLIESRAADWYDFTSRYRAGGSQHHCPAPFTSELSARIREVAVAAHRALGARDLSRADFVVAEPDTVILLEVNTLPGMTSTSLFPEAAAVAGTSFVELCDFLACRAHARPARRIATALPMP